MDSGLPDESAAGDWENVSRYLGAVTRGEDLDYAEQGVPSESSGIGQMPEVIHHERLAELMHPDATDRFRAVAAFDFNYFLQGS